MEYGVGRCKGVIIIFFQYRHIGDNAGQQTDPSIADTGRPTSIGIVANPELTSHGCEPIGQKKRILSGNRQNGICRFEDISSNCRFCKYHRTNTNTNGNTKACRFTFFDLIIRLGYG